MSYGTFQGVMNYAPKRTYKDLGFATPEAFTAYIQGLLDAVTARVDLILPQGRLDAANPAYAAVEEVVQRRVAGVIPLLVQLSTSPVFKVNEWTVQLVKTGELWDGLAEELVDLFDTDGGASPDFEVFHTGGT